MTKTRTTTMAEVCPGKCQPDSGCPTFSTAKAAGEWLGVSESAVRRAIARAGFVGRIAGPAVAGMIEVWLDFGDSVGGRKAFVPYYDSTSHPHITAEEMAR